MMPGPGPGLLVVLNGLLLFIAAAVAGVILTIRSDVATEERAVWREEALELTSEVKQTVDETTGSMDADQVARELLPLAERIQGHVRVAPSSVDAETYQQLFELGMVCETVALEHRPELEQAKDVFLSDRLDTLQKQTESVEGIIEPVG